MLLFYKVVGGLILPFRDCFEKISQDAHFCSVTACPRSASTIQRPLPHSLQEIGVVLRRHGLPSDLKNLLLLLLLLLLMLLLLLLHLS